MGRKKVEVASVKGIGISLDEKSLDVIRQAARETSIESVSATIRYIVRDWARLRNVSATRQ